LNDSGGNLNQDQDQNDSLPAVSKSPQSTQRAQSQQPQQQESIFGKDKVLGIAPMLDVTTREFRQLMRIMSKELTLWTEMVVDGTIIYAKDLDNHLGMDESLNSGDHHQQQHYDSHPIVCQIGGNSPERISQAVQKIMANYDYDEININMGCPSQLVAGKNMFGAVLMKHREVAKAAVEAMQQTVERFLLETTGEVVENSGENHHQQQHGNPTSTRRCNKKKQMRLSVKCRIGVDDWDSFELLREFIQVLSPHIQIFYIHARKAVLGGKFTTKQNRAIPPLNYPWVYALCEEFPDCEFHINGGIPDLKTAKQLCFGMQMMTKDTTKANGSEVAGYGNGNGNGNGNGSRMEGAEDEKKSDDYTTTDIAEKTKKLELQDEQEVATNQSQQQHQQPQHQHQVPCSICQFPNGSCVAAPLIVPPNLKGCMLGRAARDNPCLFWDVDRYLYGKPTNPCQNRWEVLAKYLEYIEEVVPPRCCDSNPRDTRTLPMPFQVQREYDACPLCANHGPSSMWTSDDDKDSSAPNGLSVAPMDYDLGTPKPKFSSHVFSRVLRPLIGLFNGIPNARKFRQEFDRLLKQQAPHKGGAKKATSNVTGTSAPLPCYRNCGPAVVIRMALFRAMDRKLLMQDFEKTEDIAVDYSRSIDCCKGKRTW